MKPEEKLRQKLRRLVGCGRITAVQLAEAAMKKLDHGQLHDLFENLRKKPTPLAPPAAPPAPGEAARE